MNSDRYTHLCIFDISDGLREGLSHFSQSCRTAVIFAMHHNDPLRIHDPCNLLRGHEPRIEELLLDNHTWRDLAPDLREARILVAAPPDQVSLDLSGLIAYGGWSRSIFFQVWYTEHHPDMCSTGPTIRWLEYAAGLLARNMAIEHTINIGTSGYVLKEYATHAVRDFIVDRRNVLLGLDTRLRVFPILDAVLGVSKTQEEGAWPRGRLLFIEPSDIPYLEFMARFPEREQPALINHKHIRKLLLAVEYSDRYLVSDGRQIIGISTDHVPESGIVIDFQGGQGFVRLGDDPICSFGDGRFTSSTRRANLVQVEEWLLETDLDPTSQHEIFQVISMIVHHAGESKHGCTLVLDLNDPPLKISGHNLQHPLDLRQDPILNMAMSLAKVDGAIHICSDLMLHGFACLLDGHARKGENRARGARYNSALRFTGEHPELLVIVVSVDRPVSIIQGGVELTAQCDWSPASALCGPPPMLSEWIKV